MSSVCKRLINGVDSFVDDNLEGFVAANPGLRFLKGHRRVIIRTDVDDVIAAGKVTILTGGGSGHEPGHAGCVGPGMASVVVEGPIFTSPPPRDILAGLRAVGRGHQAGVLVTFNNYTGDRLTFGMAMERAREEGIKLDVFINADDCALESVDKTAGRRGLAGGMLAIKIAGALADEGKSLPEIMEVLKYVQKNMGTIGLCLSPCSLPGSGKFFHLNDDEMGLGLGLHGEAGVKTMKITTAHETVRSMLDHMTNPANETHFQLNTGDSVACLLDNLGTLTITEMNIIGKEVINYLERRGATVERFYSSHFVTSQEMAGVSITILHLNDVTRKAVDYPTTAPTWKSPCLPPGEWTGQKLTDVERDVSEPAIDVISEEGLPTVSDDMKSLIYRAIKCCCERLISAESRLNKLDTDCGDGDCGSTLRCGAEAILKKLGSLENSGLPTECPYRLVNILASLVEESMGGSTGGLYSLFLTAASVATKRALSPEVCCSALRLGTQAVMRHGGAQPGYRTMVDALYPAVEAFEQGFKTLSGTEAFKTAVLAAEEGVKRTIGMKAQAGRASYVQISSLSEADPGATAVAIWMKGILDTIESS